MLGSEPIEEGLEVLGRDTEVGFGVGVGKTAENGGGASVGVDGAVWPRGVRRDVGVDFGGIGVNPEGGEQDAPSDGVGERAISVELALFGGSDIAGFDEAVNIGVETGLLGDSIDDVAGSGIGDIGGTGGRSSEAHHDNNDNECAEETGEAGGVILTGGFHRVFLLLTMGLCGFLCYYGINLDYGGARADEKYI